ncbi:MAG: ral secretion pathway protein [Pedosphaera sp.]|nr:ral secretion pathway protein [Pedosphaera sp.]
MAMKLLRDKTFATQRLPAAQRGSVLLIVMWITFGLICITLYFGNSMSFELRASDNRVAGVEADQAIEGAARYISLVVSNLSTPGTMPDPQSYQCEAVPVGDARYWLIGRTNTQELVTSAHFGLIDEASKLNLNVANSNMLSLLPRMTADLAASIIAWRSTNTSTGGGGAESDTYQRSSTPYLCKNSPFETVDELRLIYTMDMVVLYGEDANLNGILDPNENDGDVLSPTDNTDGQLDPGLLEYVTVYSREPSTTTNGVARFDITTAAGVTSLRTNLVALFGTARADQIMPRQGNPNPTYTSPLQFYIASKMTAAEFAQIETSIRGTRIQGLVNVNTASSAVLSCIPGLDSGKAAQLVTYRQSNPTSLNSIAWVSTVLDQSTAVTAGPWLTGKSYQYMADVAAVGHQGRGYRRTRFVFDTSSGPTAIRHRQDLSHLGWALGKQVRDQWLMAKQTP